MENTRSDVLEMNIMIELALHLGLTLGRMGQMPSPLHRLVLDGQIKIFLLRHQIGPTEEIMRHVDHLIEVAVAHLLDDRKRLLEIGMCVALALSAGLAFGRAAHLPIPQQQQMAGQALKDDLMAMQFTLDEPMMHRVDRLIEAGMASLAQRS
jgi:hypothetical protein